MKIKTGRILNERIVDEIGSTKIVFGEADFLFSKLDSEKGHIFINDSNKNYIGTPEWVPYSIINKDGCKLKYLFYILTNDLFLNNLKYLVSGKTHPRVQPRDLLNIKIPLPEPKEQDEINKKIIPVEDKIEEYRNKIKKIRRILDKDLNATIKSGLKDEFFDAGD